MTVRNAFLSKDGLELDDAGDHVVGMRRQDLPRAGAGEHPDGQAGAGGARHLQDVQAVADDGDGRGRQAEMAGEGFDHAGAGLGAVAAVIAAAEVEQSADGDYLADTRAVLERRMPDLPLGAVERAWAGLYPVSPDGLPIVGPAPGDASVILAVGGGGSGIQMSPIMGALAAEWIVHGEARSLADGNAVATDRDTLIART